jgi:hypothetical protein
MFIRENVNLQATEIVHDLLLEQATPRVVNDRPP